MLRGAMNHELEALLSLHGFEFIFASGYRVKIVAMAVEATRNRPHGIKYSLTLHDPNGRRIYGLDNAHQVRRAKGFDHRHTYGTRKIVPYAYVAPGQLLEDFYSEVERILAERGVT